MAGPDDLKKSYYEIANEEYAKDPKPADGDAVSKEDRMKTAKETSSPNTPSASVKMIMDEILAEGSEFGTDDFWAEFDKRMGIDPNSTGGPMPPEDDDEMMEAEMAKQAAMMQER